MVDSVLLGCGGRRTGQHPGCLLLGHCKNTVEPAAGVLATFLPRPADTTNGALWQPDALDSPCIASNVPRVSAAVEVVAVKVVTRSRQGITISRIETASRRVCHSGRECAAKTTNQFVKPRVVALYGKRRAVSVSWPKLSPSERPSAPEFRPAYADRSPTFP